MDLLGFIATGIFCSVTLVGVWSVATRVAQALHRPAPRKVEPPVQIPSAAVVRATIEQRYRALQEGRK